MKLSCSTAAATTCCCFLLLSIVATPSNAFVLPSQQQPGWQLHASSQRQQQPLQHLNTGYLQSARRMPGQRNNKPIQFQQQQRLVVTPSLVVLNMAASESTTTKDDADTSTTANNNNVVQNQQEDALESEIERLRSMAAKLRAEAAALEAQQAQEFADAAERAFRKFDTNRDGQVSLMELKDGLEKALKLELPESRVRTLLQKLDKSQDGVLQMDEFVTMDQFRNQLDAIRRDERRSSLEAAKVAQLEQEAAQFAQARLEILNDRPPTTVDKVLSVLPYLFPLLDSLQFGRFLFIENADNPIVPLVALLFQLYRSIPFGGFIAFFALSFLSSNPSINRLIRFNMQQAIYLDIALFFPGLIGALYTLVFSDLLGVQIPTGMGELSSDVVFAAVLLAIVYSSVSSLLGITPDKIPIISQAATDRMPTMDMFDDQGRLLPREMREASKQKQRQQQTDDDDDDKKKKENEDDNGDTK